MQVKDKIVVVTGAASGIGKAMATRFVSEGAAKVFISDIDADQLGQVAESIGAVPVVTDVTQEDQVLELVRTAEAETGAIDLMCSNAGIFIPGIEEVPSTGWQKIWEVNVMAHVYAAKAAIPAMVKNGGGYLLNTVSAAGLLSQIGSAPYSVTKHAALGLAESLAIEHSDKGIKVSIVCPQAVNTPMLEVGDGGPASVDGIMEPETLCDAVIKGLQEESFLILPHPEVVDYMRRKTSDYDRWISGMQRFKQRLSE